LDHLDCAGYQRWRHGKTERLGGLEVDAKHLRAIALKANAPKDNSLAKVNP